MKPPGVYISEAKPFPNSVVPVATSVPAFVGYTEKADNEGKSLSRVPTRIHSFDDFRHHFGGPPPAHLTTFNVNMADPAQGSTVENMFYFAGQNYTVKRTDTNPIQKQFLLYASMAFFFANGGGDCYVVSVGGYGDSIAKDDLIAGVDLLLNEQEPTMIVLPEMVHLTDRSSYQAVLQHALGHCGQMQSRIAIFDVYDGFKDRKDPSGDCITAFRNDLVSDQLKYGVAYYPWLDTSILSDGEFGYRNVATADLIALLKLEANRLAGAARTQAEKLISEIASLHEFSEDALNKALVASSPAFRQVMVQIAALLNRLPPAAAMAGIYTMVDNNRGVWKAPANVGLNSVIKPAVAITDHDQEDLNVDVVDGKSINAIRAFQGFGVLVWGARTLDGNSQDWRYINVRRTVIMFEQSIKLALRAYVFETNNAATWSTVRAMISNFLLNFWKEGALQGAKPEDAYSVNVGLGTTMTADDILNGLMNVSVNIAMVRPAEFIVMTFQQKMQSN